ncbi:SAM-dependent methyltransferase [Halomonas urumqiensis]|uniref:SAM-dependent methyltransferase n=2 Tax=Halomonas urumqiensis TaxID=1684789 RepID=A0A2N7UPT1_9GAMM|nr:SAM-dependent methyltransferase [Halomonas urumqiensis]PTB04075.1 DUF938 domain-containing protein [Halomonas urumqiensis]GHE19662.1 SAM-dependent methyltransferase [Halomonas urumqiensis]
MHDQDKRLFSPSALRNRGPILDVLKAHLPPQARVLEVASGSGEHAIHFTASMPGWQWLPSDPTLRACQSIAAWREHGGMGNLREPMMLDVTGQWPEETFDAVVAINLLHISPWEVTPALIAEAAAHLVDGGRLVIYGPFMRDNRHTAPSNAAFDDDLRARDKRWGIRDLGDLTTQAERQGLTLDRVVEMPANNLSLVFHKRPSEDVYK